jgi:hypothetical protein
MPRKRDQVSKANLEAAVDDFTAHLREILARKGMGRFASSHEALGVCTNEYHEVVEAVHRTGQTEIRCELLDLAVACVFAVASQREGWDW